MLTPEQKRFQNEPRHDKTNKMSVRPAKTQISLGICPVWSESSICTQWVAKDPSFLHADSEDSDQTDLSLRWTHSQFVGFVMSRLKCFWAISSSRSQLDSKSECRRLGRSLAAWQTTEEQSCSVWMESSSRMVFSSVCCCRAFRWEVLADFICFQNLCLLAQSLATEEWDFFFLFCFGLFSGVSISEG